MLMDVGSDFRYAVRGLVRTPGLTLGIILTLAVGIGANAMIFSAIDALLLRPAMVEDPEQLVQVYSATNDARARFASSSNPDYVDLRDQGGFEGLAAFASVSLALDRDGTTSGLIGQVVSGNYFDVLGVRVARGRGFLPSEDQASAPAYVTVLSDAAWQKYFAGDPGLVGQPITLNGRPFTVVGIAPPRFTGPVLGQAPEAWVPMALQPEVRPPSAGLRRSLGTSALLNARAVGWLNMVARLPRGTTPDAARVTLDVMAGRLEAAYPDSNRGRRFTLMPLGEGPGVRTASRPLLRVLGISVGLVLLIACANVAGLLVVRAIARQKETAVRLAIGASRLRLVRQWLTESLLLALLGAAGGILMAAWTMPLLYGLGIPPSIDLSVNMRVVAFALAAATISAVAFGCASVIQTLSQDVLTALRQDGRCATATARTGRVRSAFVVTQVALTLVLLAGAALFLQTLQNAYAVDLGYAVDRTLLTDVNLDVRGYSPPAGQLVYARIIERIAQTPGVTAVGAARVVVLSGNERVARVSTNGAPLAADGSNALVVRTNVVSDGYLDALDVRVLRGRNFGPADHAGSPRVAIVSRSLADRLWPDADPIGKRLIGSGPPFEVIGVVQDLVYSSPIETDAPAFFFSLLAQNYEAGVTLHIRTAVEPADIFPAVRQAVRDVDPLLALSTPVGLRTMLQQTLGDQRMMARLVSVFGAIAIVLAIIGLYGVMAHLVVQRRAEIGVRLALGAQPRAILQLVLGYGLRLVLLGVPIGIAVALAASRYVRSQMFGVDATDPTTLAGVSVFFVLIAAVACLIPGRRALKFDPTIALREGGSS